MAWLTELEAIAQSLEKNNLRRGLLQVQHLQKSLRSGLSRAQNESWHLRESKRSMIAIPWDILKDFIDKPMLDALPLRESLNIESNRKDADDARDTRSETHSTLLEDRNRLASRCRELESKVAANSKSAKAGHSGKQHAELKMEKEREIVRRLQLELQGKDELYRERGKALNDTITALQHEIVQLKRQLTLKSSRQNKTKTSRTVPPAAHSQTQEESLRKLEEENGRYVEEIQVLQDKLRLVTHNQSKHSNFASPSRQEDLGELKASLRATLQDNEALRMQVIDLKESSQSMVYMAEGISIEVHRQMNEAISRLEKRVQGSCQGAMGQLQRMQAQMLELVPVSRTALTIRTAHEQGTQASAGGMLESVAFSVLEWWNQQMVDWEDSVAMKLEAIDLKIRKIEPWMHDAQRHVNILKSSNHLSLLERDASRLSLSVANESAAAWLRKEWQAFDGVTRSIFDATVVRVSSVALRLDAASSQLHRAGLLVQRQRARSQAALYAVVHWAKSIQLYFSKIKEALCQFEGMSPRLEACTSQVAAARTRIQWLADQHAKDRATIVFKDRLLAQSRISKQQYNQELSKYLEEQANLEVERDLAQYTMSPRSAELIEIPMTEFSDLRRRLEELQNEVVDEKKKVRRTELEKQNMEVELAVVTTELEEMGGVNDQLQETRNLAVRTTKELKSKEATMQQMLHRNEESLTALQEMLDRERQRHSTALIGKNLQLRTLQESFDLLSDQHKLLLAEKRRLQIDLGVSHQEVESLKLKAMHLSAIEEELATRQGVTAELRLKLARTEQELQMTKSALDTECAAKEVSLHADQQLQSNLDILRLSYEQVHASEQIHRGQVEVKQRHITEMQTVLAAKENDLRSMKAERDEERALEERQKQLLKEEHGHAIAEYKTALEAEQQSVQHLKAEIAEKAVEIQNLNSSLSVSEERVSDAIRASYEKELDDLRVECDSLRGSGLESDSLRREVRALKDQLVRYEQRSTELETSVADAFADYESIVSQYATLMTAQDAIVAEKVSLLDKLTRLEESKAALEANLVVAREEKNTALMELEERTASILDEQQLYSEAQTDAGNRFRDSLLNLHQDYQATIHSERIKCAQLQEQVADYAAQLSDMERRGGKEDGPLKEKTEALEELQAPGSELLEAPNDGTDVLPAEGQPPSRVAVSKKETAEMLESQPAENTIQVKSSNMVMSEANSVSIMDVRELTAENETLKRKLRALQDRMEKHWEDREKSAPPPSTSSAAVMVTQSSNAAPALVTLEVLQAPDYRVTPPTFHSEQNDPELPLVGTNDESSDAQDMAALLERIAELQHRCEVLETEKASRNARLLSMSAELSEMRRLHASIVEELKLRRGSVLVPTAVQKPLSKDGTVHQPNVLDEQAPQEVAFEEVEKIHPADNPANSALVKDKSVVDSILEITDDCVRHEDQDAPQNVQSTPLSVVDTSVAVLAGDTYDSANPAGCILARQTPELEQSQVRLAERDLEIAVLKNDFEKQKVEWSTEKTEIIARNQEQRLAISLLEEKNEDLSSMRSRLQEYLTMMDLAVGNALNTEEQRLSVAFDSCNASLTRCQERIGTMPRVSMLQTRIYELERTEIENAAEIRTLQGDMIRLRDLLDASSQSLAVAEAEVASLTEKLRRTQNENERISTLSRIATAENEECNATDDILKPLVAVTASPEEGSTIASEGEGLTNADSSELQCVVLGFTDFIESDSCSWDEAFGKADPVLLADFDAWLEEVAHFAEASDLESMSRMRVMFGLLLQYCSLRRQQVEAGKHLIVDEKEEEILALRRQMEVLSGEVSDIRLRCDDQLRESAMQIAAMEGSVHDAGVTVTGKDKEIALLNQHLQELQFSHEGSLKEYQALSAEVLRLRESEEDKRIASPLMVDVGVDIPEMAMDVSLPENENNISMVPTPMLHTKSELRHQAGTEMLEEIQTEFNETRCIYEDQLRQIKVRRSCSLPQNDAEEFAPTFQEALYGYSEEAEVEAPSSAAALLLEPDAYSSDLGRPPVGIHRNAESSPAFVELSANPTFANATLAMEEEEEDEKEQAANPTVVSEALHSEQSDQELSLNSGKDELSIARQVTPAPPVEEPYRAMEGVEESLVTVEGNKYGSSDEDIVCERLIYLSVGTQTTGSPTDAMVTAPLTDAVFSETPLQAEPNTVTELLHPEEKEKEATESGREDTDTQRIVLHDLVECLTQLMGSDLGVWSAPQSLRHVPSRMESNPESLLQIRDCYDGLDTDTQEDASTGCIQTLFALLSTYCTLRQQQATAIESTYRELMETEERNPLEISELSQKAEEIRQREQGLEQRLRALEASRQADLQEYERALSLSQSSAVAQMNAVEVELATNSDLLQAARDREAELIQQLSRWQEQMTAERANYLTLQLQHQEAEQQVVEMSQKLLQLQENQPRGSLEGKALVTVPPRDPRAGDLSNGGSPFPSTQPPLSLTISATESQVSDLELESECSDSAPVSLPEMDAEAGVSLSFCRPPNGVLHPDYENMNALQGESLVIALKMELLHLFEHFEEYRRSQSGLRLLMSAARHKEHRKAAETARLLNEKAHELEGLEKMLRKTRRSWEDEMDENVKLMKKIASYESQIKVLTSQLLSS
jgi:hypothetical protein